ncbi:TlpA disulfide reductase family protein [Pedobacter ginsengisoli]|uniref:TlpA disulfide reductase family protein n=1 Tax=Pedobacter ginsengisoli TaxID=363852 RepID=UPI00254B6E8C|nr:TlpA disulfide reductase family protein [Pedobacter ginsengisoli]
MKIALIMLCIITGAYAQNKRGFVLNGNIEGLKDGSTIYLLSSSRDTIKAVSKGTSFMCKGYVDSGTNFYFLKLDTAVNKVSKIGRNAASNVFWLINSTLQIQGSVQNWQNLILTGSEPHEEYVKLRALQDSVNKQKGDVIGVLKRFVNEHPNSLYVSDLILRISANYSNDELRLVYNALTDRAKKSYWGLKLGERVNGIKKGLKTAPGIIADFSITTVNGDKKSIHDLASKSKYTLIDFWASWCGPCRAAIPKLNKAYEAFHARGFNIIGVSTDKDAKKWKNALKEDKTPWDHGLDNIDNASESIFEIAGIPGYILIDQKGKILKTDIFTRETGAHQFVRSGDKRLRTDLYEIIEELLKKEK